MSKLFTCVQRLCNFIKYIHEDVLSQKHMKLGFTHCGLAEKVFVLRKI